MGSTRAFYLGLRIRDVGAWQNGIFMQGPD